MPLIRNMSIQDMPDVLYAHGCLMERSLLTRQSRSHSSKPFPFQEPDGLSPGSQQSGSSQAGGAAGSSSGPLSAGTADSAAGRAGQGGLPAARDLAHFLAAAAKRFKGSKEAGRRFQLSRLATLSAGLYGLALAAQVGGCVMRPLLMSSSIVSMSHFKQTWHSQVGWRLTCMHVPASMHAGAAPTASECSGSPSCHHRASCVGRRDHEAFARSPRTWAVMSARGASYACHP